jgi:hypothetical protein
MIVVVGGRCGLEGAGSGALRFPIGTSRFTGMAREIVKVVKAVEVVVDAIRWV